MRYYVQALILAITLITSSPSFAEDDIQWIPTQKAPIQGNSVQWRVSDLIFKASMNWNDTYVHALSYAAEKGNPAAQNWIGEIYAHRQNSQKLVEVNHTKAIKWFQLSADQGYHNAQKNLAFAYMSGNGVEKNFSKAMRIFNEIAYNDCSLMDEMAYSFASGMNDFPQDSAQYIFWMEKQAGPPERCVSVWNPPNLAMAYSTGTPSLKPDAEKAYFWALVSKHYDTDGFGLPNTALKEAIDKILTLPLDEKKRRRAQLKFEAAKSSLGVQPVVRPGEMAASPGLELVSLDQTNNATYLEILKDHKAYTPPQPPVSFSGSLRK